MPTPAAPPGPCAVAPVVDVTVPVYNEEHVLRSSIERLHAYLSSALPWAWRITIADNASTDSTRQVAHALAAELPAVRVVELDRKGRGRALRAAWTATDAEVVAYMDVDLSTGLEALAPMVAAIRSGHSELAIGSRLAPGAAVARGPRREFISRTYNRILRAIFLTRFRDAQCGFKAVRADVAQALLPLVEDEAWFFDTELLLLAEHNGLRILEVPVDWVDDPDSRVHVVATARDDLRGVLRVFASFLRGHGRADLGSAARAGLTDDMGRQLVTFLKVGVLSTLASLAIYLLAFAYLLFVLLYFPCVATIGAIRRETGSAWAAFVASWSTGIAFFTATVYYQAATYAAHPQRSLMWIIGLGVLLLSAIVGLRWWAQRGGRRIQEPDWAET